MSAGCGALLKRSNVLRGWRVNISVSVSSMTGDSWRFRVRGDICLCFVSQCGVPIYCRAQCAGRLCVRYRDVV